MSPFLKIMQLFLMMTGTVLGMLLLLLVTPDIEDSLLRAVARHQRRRHPPAEAPVLSSPGPVVRVADQHVESKLMFTVRLRGVDMTVELDRNRKSYTPWANSEDCNRYRIHFARPKSLPLTALVSFPGSGNTWVRYLIEAASGVFTGSVYEDPMLISKGLYGEAAPLDCGCTTVQKTHGSIGNSKESLAQIKTFKGRGILLMRNPYDALLSYMNFISGGHTGFAPHDAFKGPVWEAYVKKMTNTWRDLAAMWINCTTGANAMVVHFEHLHVDPRRDLRSLLHFLGIAADDGRLSCVLKHVDGQFKRQPSSTQKMWFSKKDPFTRKQHQLIDNAIEFIDRMLKDRGWERIPLYLYKFYSKRRNASILSRVVNSTKFCM